MHGTWQTTGGGGGSPAGLLVAVAAAVALAGVAAGIAEVVMRLVLLAACALGAVLCVAAGAVAWWAVHRRRASLPLLPQVMRPLVQQHERWEHLGGPGWADAVPRPQRPAVGPREVHNHVHIHVGDAGQAAEVMRLRGEG